MATYLYLCLFVDIHDDLSGDIAFTKKRWNLKKQNYEEGFAAMIESENAIEDHENS